MTVNSTAEVRRGEVLGDADGDSLIAVSCSQLWGAWKSHKDKCKEWLMMANEKSGTEPLL